MSCSRIVSAVVIGLASASAAHAAEHKLYFVGNGFFPETVYADTGDVVHVINMSVNTSTVTLTGDVAVADPLCGDPDKWKDLDPDCDNGWGNNTPTDDVISDTAALTLAVNEETAFIVKASTDPLTVTGRSGATNAKYSGVIATNQNPNLGF